MPEVPIAALVHSHFVHHSLAGTGGSAKVILAVDGSWVYLVADGLVPGSRHVLSVNDTPVGAVNADGSGRASAYWPLQPGKVGAASLAGSDGSVLQWRTKP
jgi:hypothetical protein